MKQLLVSMLGLVLVIVGLVSGCGKEDKIVGNQVTITNVSYDTTREFYEQFNQLFHDAYLTKTGMDVKILQSHGGSSGQARSVMEGNDADVVTLGSEQDVNLLKKVKLLDESWNEALPNHSAPYTSTIVMLVRRGNPLKIHDWDDLVKPYVQIIAPDPKSSSGACWIFLAAWYYGSHYYGSDDGAKEFVRQLYHNVLVMDSGSRGATTSFVENKQGDVLLLWENEAFHLLEEYPDTYEMIVPSMSVLAEPTVAIVTGVTDKDKTTDIAKDYLLFLYTKEAQRLLADYGFRPSDQAILDEYKWKFDRNVRLKTVRDFGGWTRVYNRFFKDGGVFDEIYQS